MILAGHDMQHTVHGLRCIGTIHDGKPCGRRAVDLAAVQRQHIGQPGWAHYGNLDEAEYLQIRAWIDWVWTCTSAIASGQGIGGMAAGGVEEL